MLNSSTHCEYREVTKARERKTGRLVALKKVKMEKEKEGVSVKIHVLKNSDMYMYLNQYLYYFDCIEVSNDVTERNSSLATSPP